MQKLKLLIALLMLPMFIVGSFIGVLADIENETVGNTTSIETGSLVVEIKGGGNVPFFFFWDPNNEGAKYKLQFDSIFEVVDNSTTADGIYIKDDDRRVPNSGIPSLAPLTWEFSKIIEEKDANEITTKLDFNLTSTSNSMSISFNIHLSLEESAQLKFDVIIDGYTFSDDNAMLVLRFKLINQGVSDDFKKDSQTINFGNGFFQSEPNAQDDNGEINVGLSTGTSDPGENGSPKIYLAYENFEGRMVHDPTIGVINGEKVIESDQKLRTGNKILPDLSKESLVVPTVISTLALILIPAIIYYRKRNS